MAGIESSTKFPARNRVVSATRHEADTSVTVEVDADGGGYVHRSLPEPAIVLRTSSGEEVLLLKSEWHLITNGILNSQA